MHKINTFIFIYLYFYLYSTFENLLPPENVAGYGKICRLLAAMTCMECGIRMEQVDEEAVCQGYRLAFPENNGELDEWLMAEDEYRNW